MSFDESESESDYGMNINSSNNNNNNQYEDEDEEVFGLQGIDSQSDDNDDEEEIVVDDEDDDESEIEEEELLENFKKQNYYHSSNTIDNDDDEKEQENARAKEASVQKLESWGGKDQYYDAETDEDEDEVAEAMKIQKSLLNSLSQSDFQIDISNSTPLLDDEDDITTTAINSMKFTAFRDDYLRFSSPELKKNPLLSLLLTNLTFCIAITQKRFNSHPIFDDYLKLKTLYLESIAVKVGKSYKDSKPKDNKLSKKKSVNTKIAEKRVDSSASETTQRDNYYEEVAEKKERRIKDRQEYYDNLYTPLPIPVESPLEETDKRRASRHILVNRGLTPYRKKENRNPRVKKKIRFAKAIKKLASTRAVVVDRRSLANGYQGEVTGIKSNLSKSVKF